MGFMYRRYGNGWILPPGEGRAKREASESARSEVRVSLTEEEEEEEGNLVRINAQMPAAL